MVYTHWQKIVFSPSMCDYGKELVFQQLWLVAVGMNKCFNHIMVIKDTIKKRSRRRISYDKVMSQYGSSLLGVMIFNGSPCLHFERGQFIEVLVCFSRKRMHYLQTKGGNPLSNLSNT